MGCVYGKTQTRGVAGWMNVGGGSVTILVGLCRSLFLLLFILNKGYPYMIRWSAVRYVIVGTGVVVDAGYWLVKPSRAKRLKRLAG